MVKLISLEDLKDIDYSKLGFMSGLEIHQQLNTGKLFCSCPCEIVENNSVLGKEVERRLRFAMSEGGQIDGTALNEFKKGKYNKYKYNDEIACLVDLDEEPPKGPNERALSVAIRISKMLNLNLFDKIQFMRKLIIDGSITSGYQRTAILGINGFLETSFGRVNIEGVNLEEDSCRTLERFDDHTVFALDRQGIPLIEITTGPQIKRPEEALELALSLGNILRSFPETKRGLGTIRQDLNVSIRNGARVEIKGTQNLKLIPEIIKSEIRRQRIYLSILDELKDRGIEKDNFSDGKIYDVTSVFENTKSSIILSNLSLKNSKVLAIKLNGFKDILGHELNENYRFATEISNRNKAHFPMIKGLFHSDELPKYGIVEEEVDSIKRELKLGKEDSFILIVNEEIIAKNSLKNVLSIIEFLMEGVPEEVRQVDPKGTVTIPLRPMPGAARMYPETDIKDIELTEDYLRSEFEKIPELYGDKINRLKSEFDLDENRIEMILESMGEDVFREYLRINSNSKVVYNLLFELGKEVRKREGLEIFELSSSLIEDILRVLNEGKLNKNSLYNLMVLIYKNGLVSIDNFDEFLENNGLLMEEINEDEIEKKIIEIISKNKSAPFGALMGICMKEFGGRVEGRIISNLLKKNIK